MVLVKGETTPIALRLDTTISSPFILFVFEVNNDVVSFCLASSANYSTITGLHQYDIFTDSYFDHAGTFIYNIYEKDSNTTTVGDSEPIKTGYCRVEGDGVTYTEHEPDNTYTVR